MPPEVNVPSNDTKPGSDPAVDRTSGQRRKGLNKDDIHDLELAGGVEGGMQAGSAGGPSADDHAEDDRTDGKGNDQSQSQGD